MKVLASLLAAVAAACAYGAWRLWRGIDALIAAGDYRPGIYTGYRIGDFEADGSGIGLPVFLLLALAIFCALWAWRLWHEGRRPSGRE